MAPLTHSIRFGLLWALALLCGFAQAEPRYHALVDARLEESPLHSRFRSIGAALAAAPADAGEPHVIYIRDGRYREQLVIDRPQITLIGQSRDGTVLTFDAYAGQLLPGTDEKRSTRRTATLTVRATDFRAETLTVENSFDFLANDALATDHPRKIHGTQAVALMTANGADRVAMRNVRLSGYQDTLYVDSGRSLFANSIVEGNVDFIFGAGRALFVDSDIVSRPRGRAQGHSGYVTAPSTDIGDEYGLVFLRCRLLKEPGVAPGSTPLGRPWHPTRDFPDGRYADPRAIGASVFLDSYMDDHIAPNGWASMHGTSRDGSKSTLFTPQQARFFEYRSRGPGAVINGGRRQLSDAEAGIYIPRQILGDWQAPYLAELKPLAAAESR